MNQPERRVVFQIRIPSVFEKQPPPNFRGAEMTTSVPLYLRIQLDELGGLRPMPDAGNHVLSNTQPDQGVVFREERRALVHTPNPLLQPPVAEHECLVPGKLVLDVGNHIAHDCNPCDFSRPHEPRPPAPMRPRVNSKRHPQPVTADKLTLKGVWERIGPWECSTHGHFHPVHGAISYKHT